MEQPQGNSRDDGGPNPVADDQLYTPGRPKRSAASEPNNRPLPDAAVVRLATYLRALVTMEEGGITVASSDELAVAAGVNAAKLRKDLAFMGSNGVRGVGYEVHRLRSRIQTTLGLDRRHEVVLVGAGNLGHALAGYDGFARRGFRVAALFDDDDARVGEKVGGIRIQHVDDIAFVCAQLDVTMAIVATPADAAQPVCDRLVDAGVRCILNFAPVELAVPDGIDVRKVDLAAELQVLSFHMARRAGGGAGGPGEAAAGLDADDLDADEPVADDPGGRELANPRADDVAPVLP